MSNQLTLKVSEDDVKIILQALEDLKNKPNLKLHDEKYDEGSLFDLMYDIQGQIQPEEE